MELTWEDCCEGGEKCLWRGWWVWKEFFDEIDVVGGFEIENVVKVRGVSRE